MCFTDEIDSIKIEAFELVYCFLFQLKIKNFQKNLQNLQKIK